MVLTLLTSCNQARNQDTTAAEESKTTLSSEGWVVKDITVVTEPDPDSQDEDEDDYDYETQPTWEIEPPTAYWFDSNFNFSHDPDDYYYVDCEQVSMSEYYEALEQNKDVYPAFDAISTLEAGRICEDLLYDEDLLPMEDCDLVSMKTVTVRFGGEEYVEGRVPQINIKSRDAEKVNKEIIKTIRNAGFHTGGTPETRYHLIEHDDGSKTLLWYYLNCEEMIYKAYTFDSKGNLMSLDEILKSIGYTKKDFMEAASKKLQKDLDLADIFNSHNYGGYTSAYTMKCFKEDPEIFINELGQAILILKCELDRWVCDGWFDLLYPCEFQIEKQDKINICTESLKKLNSLREYTNPDFEVSLRIQNNDLAFVDNVEYAKNDEEFYVFDFTSSTNIKNFDTKTVPDYAGALLCYFEKDGHTGFMGCDMIHSKLLYCKVGLPEAISDKGSYWYEVYKKGKLIHKGSITKDGNHSYQSLSFCCGPVNSGPCCVVVYEMDKYDEGSILAAGWYDLFDFEE